MTSLADHLNADGVFVCPTQTVLDEWIDYNGHMNMAFYHVIFDRGLDVVFNHIGVGADYVQQGGSCFTVEVHVTYRQELNLADPVRVEYQLLDCDAKRLHTFARMYHATEGYLAATSEQMCLHVGMETRRAGPFPDAIRAKADALYYAQRHLPKPQQAGQVIGIKRR